jgi:hypothetical protein
MSGSQRRINDDEHGDAKNGQEDRPLYPNGFTMMLKQFWKQVKNGDTQAINGVEQYAEKYDDLKDPVLINIIYERSALPAQKRCQNMRGNEDRHAQPTNAMQDERQHWALSLIPQTRGQADISFQAHLCLLEKNRIYISRYAHGYNDTRAYFTLLTLESQNARKKQTGAGSSAQLV